MEGMKRPYASLCLIAGDEALAPCTSGTEKTGFQILARLLNSVLDRAGGPMVDEVVIGWNGTKRDELDKIVLTPRIRDAATIKIVPRAWDGNFASARQASFEAASGEWRGYLDSDDVIPEAGHPAIAESLAFEGVTDRPQAVQAGTLTESASFMAWLKGLPGAINAVWQPYHYIIGGDGRCIQRTWHNRWVRWHEGWVWREPVHEDLVPAGGNVARMAWNAALPILHYPVVSSEDRIRRNVDVLKRMKAEAEAGKHMPDFRLLYGLGTALHAFGDLNGAVAELQRAVEVAPARMEKLQALLVLVQCHLGMGDPGRAGMAALMAIDVSPDTPEGYLALGEAKYHQGDFGAAATWYEHGAARKATASRFLVDQPLMRAMWPKVWASTSYLRCGYVDRACQLAKEATDIAPDPAALRALREARQAKTTADAVTGSVAVLAWCVMHDEIEQGAKLASALPDEIAESPDVASAVANLGTAVRADPTEPVDHGFPASFAQARGWDGDIIHRLEYDGAPAHTIECRHHGSIVASPHGEPGVTPGRRRMTPKRILAIAETIAERAGGVVLQDMEVCRDRLGSAWTMARFTPGSRRPMADEVAIYAPCYSETWGPWTPRDTGIGASEEVIVYLANELAKKGWPVQVFAPLPDSDVHVAQGVRWRHLREFDHRTRRRWLIAHRAPWIVRQPGIGAQHVAVWHQDNWYRDDIWGPKTCDGAVHVTPSLWLARRLMREGRIERMSGIVLPNAVPDCHFADSVTNALARDPHRVIYASNPTRGLDKLLDVWPEIKAAVPDAKLDVFYGWELVMALAHFGAKELVEFRSSVEATLAAMADLDVTWRGRVGQATLAMEMKKAGVMAYPVFSFEEGYCTSLARALAAGMIPVFPATGALPEVQPEQKYMVALPWTQGGKIAFIQATIAALNDTGFDRMAKSRLVPSWSRTAARWEALLEAPDDVVQPIESPSREEAAPMAQPSSSSI